MRALAAGILLSSLCSAPLLAQDRDRWLERIALGLQQPSPIVTGVAPIESTLPKKVGIFTLVPPTKRGEMVRVSIPIGDLVMRAFRGVAAANQRRQEAGARRRVEAELESLTRRQP